MTVATDVTDQRFNRLRLHTLRRLVAVGTGTIGYPDRHAFAVAERAAEIADRLQVAPVLQRAIVDGALLHDIGKAKVDPSILNKPGPLNDEERAVVNTHPVAGQEMLDGLVDEGVLDVVRAHHERWDGGGYPDGLAAEEIPLAARVVAVADAFLAMLEERPYREPKSVDGALEELRACAGSQFDARCVEALAATVVHA